jgi:hypothetical protein
MDHILTFIVVVPLSIVDAEAQTTYALKEEGFGALTPIGVKQTLKEKT